MSHYRVKPRKCYDRHSKFICDPEMSGYENLAMAIVHQAKTDAERLKGEEKVWTENRWIKKSELIRFFESAWCDTLLGRTNLSGRDIKEKIGL